ncbi:hypothetical protein M7I_2439 [Glarea lozoyensis 74030]|uniref:Uncharacterized protein n=1 Tax=Glarea lozoyensis (strain ATCC 74030 / MF5533) TaxID=1104152 RepID=H0EIS3_GLAL7|nr:hypothetical protein M7I_2439 [Glarea lozoyensis 74030]
MSQALRKVNKVYKKRKEDQSPEKKVIACYQHSGPQKSETPSSETQSSATQPSDKQPFSDNSSSQKPLAPYTITRRGTNSQGNRYDNRVTADGPAYHYSNRDGSYYYANGDKSTYYNDGQGGSIYTAPNGKVYQKQNDLAINRMYALALVFLAIDMYLGVRSG